MSKYWLALLDPLRKKTIGTSSSPPQTSIFSERPTSNPLDTIVLLINTDCKQNSHVSYFLYRGAFFSIGYTWAMVILFTNWILFGIWGSEKWLFFLVSNVLIMKVEGIFLCLIQLIDQNHLSQNRKIGDKIIDHWNRKHTANYKNEW